MKEVATNDRFDQLVTLLDATDKANPAQAAVEKLKHHLVKYPELASIAGDLVHQATLQIVNHALGYKKGAAISVEAYCEQLRDSLGYQTGAAIEKMLIQNICLCWLRLYVCECRYEATMQENITLAQGAYWENKLSQNQKRYLRAIETLAKVRRLMKEPKSPAFNLLLAQQINNR